MEECGVAICNQQPILMDRMGVKCDNDGLFGLPCTHTLKHPDMCLAVDEVGSNLSQKGDGHIRGTKYMCEKGTVPQIKVQHREKFFTLLGFTALSSEPVLCLVSIAGIQMKINVETGIAPFAAITGKETDADYFDKIFGPGKLFSGGPTCHFRGKNILCLVRWSPKGGITSEILATNSGDQIEYICLFLFWNNR